MPPKHATYAAEQELLRLVEEGSMAYQQAMDRMTSVGEMGKMGSRERMRHQKNVVIIFTTLCSRAAIRGGMVSETALTLADEYIRNAEQAGEISELETISRKMIQEYVLRVHRIKAQGGSVSSQIQRVCDYIDLNLDRKISIHFLADMFGYGLHSYFGDIFRKMTGESPSEYKSRL